CWNSGGAKSLEKSRPRHRAGRGEEEAGAVGAVKVPKIQERGKEKDRTNGEQEPGVAVRGRRKAGGKRSCG
ncbi:MAG: hypothetical protein ACPLQO_06955, partial [Desulfotomaculales bacterium]